ncbi:MAG: hypothetical protein KAS67_06235 [Thermoplasmata archaeon]|nr:hypothetical protein [Thermoplasmata archaeon]
MSCNKEDQGTVKVVNGRYKPSGKFHYPAPNTPIRDETGKLLGITNPRDIVHIHSYGGEAIFFASMAEGKLVASRCDNPNCETTGSIYMPFRIHCPDCLMKNTVVDITDKAKANATVYSFMTTERTGAFNSLPTPIKFVNVEFEGVCTILMGALIRGEPRMGMKVVPIFKTKSPDYIITDMLWVAEGTQEADLPEGYTF